MPERESNLALRSLGALLAETDEFDDRGARAARMRSATSDQRRAEQYLERFGIDAERFAATLDARDDSAAEESLADALLERLSALGITWARAQPGEHAIGERELEQRIVALVEGEVERRHTVASPPPSDDPRRAR